MKLQARGLLKSENKLVYYKHTIPERAASRPIIPVGQ